MFSVTVPSAPPQNLTLEVQNSKVSCCGWTAIWSAFCTRHVGGLSSLQCKNTNNTQRLNRPECNCLHYGGSLSPQTAESVAQTHGLQSGTPLSLCDSLRLRPAAPSWQGEGGPPLIDSQAANAPVRKF